MKHLMIEKNKIYHIAETPSASETARREAGYVFFAPHSKSQKNNPARADLRFLILTLSDDGNSPEEAKIQSVKSEKCSARMRAIWDYAAANDIHDIYLLPDEGMIRDYPGRLRDFVSMFPERKGIKLHLCLTADDYNGTKIKDFMEVCRTRTADFPHEPAEAVMEDSKLYLLADDRSFSAEERAELNRLESLPPMSGERMERCDEIISRIVHHTWTTFDYLLGTRCFFLKGWNNDLTHVDGVVFLPVNDCVDVCAFR